MNKKKHVKSAVKHIIDLSKNIGLEFCYQAKKDEIIGGGGSYNWICCSSSFYNSLVIFRISHLYAI